jgi:hypothetical protein
VARVQAVSKGRGEKIFCEKIKSFFGGFGSYI